MNIAISPVQHIKNLTMNLDTAVLEFSKYVYEPQSIFDNREIININANQLSDDWLLQTMSNLKSNEELAVHSKIMIKNRTYHIPMIDFCCSKEDIIYSQKCIASVMQLSLSSGMVYFDSGRSLHAYGSLLLKPNEWKNFMGALLLANYPNSTPVIDSRWIGHRIIGGFSSLRLSNNSGTYLGYPQKI